MSEYCFVIQPFDGGKFDKRYSDVFEPAIRKLDNIEPYRVDKDDFANIPIETIEEKIKNCRFCLADITTDNPNVWYEVGYALAFGKNVILVCSNERTNGYPFDIRHRNIISYKTESSSDFDALRNNIVEKATAILRSPPTFIPNVSENIDANKLDNQEIVLLESILGEQDSPKSGVSTWIIKKAMLNNGLNEIAFSISVRKLLTKGILKCEQETDYNGNEYSVYYITEAGNAWVLKNSGVFNINKESSESEGDFETIPDSDDLPF